MAIPRSEAASEAPKVFRYAGIASELAGRLPRGKESTALEVQPNQSPVVDFVDQIIDLVSEGKISEALKIVDEVLPRRLYRMISSSDAEIAVETLQQVLREKISQFEAEASAAPGAVAAVERPPLTEGTSNFAFLVGFARESVPDFLQLGGRDIDVFKDRADQFSEAERNKILRDFHLFLMAVINDNLDDAANKTNGFAATIGSKKVLRVVGEWIPNGDEFKRNMSRTEQSDPRSMYDWGMIMPKGLSELWSKAREIPEVFVGINNQAKKVLKYSSAGIKVSDESDVIYGIFGEGKDSKGDVDVSFEPAKVFALLTTATIKEETVTYLDQKGVRRELLTRKIDRVENPFLADLVRQTMYLLDQSYRGIPVTYMEGSVKKNIDIPVGFPQDVGSRQGMYIACEKVLRALVQRESAKPDSRISDLNSEQVDLLIRWAIESVYSLAWAYMDAMKFDAKAQKLGYSEGANAATYHARDYLGFPGKTVYDEDDSSKGKTPRVTDRPVYYVTPLEYYHSNLLLDKDNVEIGQTAASMKEYFEDYFFSRYSQPGDSDSVKREKRNKSMEFIQAIGKIPATIYFGSDGQGPVDYDAIAREFIVINVRPEKTPLGIGGDKLLFRRTPKINQELQQIQRGERKHLAVKVNMYDALYRLGVPLYDEESGVLYLDPREQADPQIAKKYLGDVTRTDMSFFMAAASTKDKKDSIGPIKYPLADKVDWYVDPTLVISQRRALFGATENLSKISPKLGQLMVRLTNSRLNGQTADIGLTLFESALGTIRIQGREMRDKFKSTGLVAFSDQLFNYYYTGAASGEQGTYPQPQYDQSGKLVGTTFDTQKPNYPLLFERTFRNVFVHWRETPYYASRRSFEAMKLIDQAEFELSQPGVTPARKKELQDNIKKASFVIKIDLPFLTLLSTFTSKFMYPMSPDEYRSMQGNQIKSLVENMYLVSGTKDTVTGDIPVHMPEDVAVETEFFVRYLRFLVSSLYKDVRGEYPPTDEALDTFMGSLVPSTIRKNPHDADTWGFSMDELRQLVYTIYKGNDIIAGPKAGSTAFDWYTLATQGKISRLGNTEEFMRAMRQTRGKPNLLGWELSGFIPESKK